MVYRIYCTPFLVYRIYYVKQCIDVAHPSWSIEFTMLNSLQILRVIIKEPQPVQPDSYRERNVTFVCDCTFSYTNSIPKLCYRDEVSKYFTVKICEHFEKFYESGEQ